MSERFYNVKIVTTDDRVEIYKVNNYVIKEGNESKNRNGRRGKGELNENEKEVNSKRGRKTTLVNARNNIIRLIKANNDMETFITLTFNKETNYQESKRYLNNFFNKLRRTYSDLKYIWVLEYGSLKERLHYHILCNIPINIKLSGSKERKTIEHKNLENEFNKKYWGYGFVDIRSLNQEGNTNVALYVSCYITKSMEDKELEGYRIYGYSNKTLKKPAITKVYMKESIEEILSNFDDYYIKFQNNYKIGYESFKGEYKGTVNYFDLYKKECFEYENK